MEDLINTLSKLKPGTAEWLAEANRIFRSQTGRDLTKEEIRNLYSSYSKTYKPNWTNPTTYRGTPGNVIMDEQIRTNAQAKRPPVAPKAQIGTYNPPVNNTLGKGSPLQFSGPTAQSVTPKVVNPPSTTVNPNFIVKSGTPIQINGPTSNWKNYFKFPIGNYNPDVNYILKGNTPLQVNGPTLQSVPNPTVTNPPSTIVSPNYTTTGGSPLQSNGATLDSRLYQKQPLANYNPDVNYRMGAGSPLQPGYTRPQVNSKLQLPSTNVIPQAGNTASKAGGVVQGLNKFLTSPANNFMKTLGTASAITSAVPFYNALYNPDATVGDRILDTVTGVSYLSGLGSLVPPALTVGPVPVGLIAQGAGKVGPLAGLGLSAIPRSYNKEKQTTQPVQNTTQTKQDSIPAQPIAPTSIADKVAYGANITTGTKFPTNMQVHGDLTPTQQMIVRIAKEEGVDPSLALAVAGVESNFNPQAKSPAGAYGLMQLMPDTAKGLGVDMYSPEDNVRGGLRYLRDNMKRFNNSLNLALAGYNAGPGAVEKYSGVPPYAETQNYINKVGKSKKHWDNVLSYGIVSTPTAPTAKSTKQNPIVSAFIPPAQAETVNQGQMGGAGVNPVQAIPEPKSDDASYQMLYQWIKDNPQGNTNINVNASAMMNPYMSGTAYNPYQWLLPQELAQLNNANTIYNISPDKYMEMMTAYAKWLQSARAKDQALGNIYNMPTFSADGGLNPKTAINDLATLYSNQIKNEQNIYDNLMKRADSRYMSYRYGMPFNSFKDNAGDVLQYIVKPTMEQQWKEQNRVPDTMMELIKKENEGEITRKNEREKGRVEIAKTNNEWGNYRYPGMMNTLSSIEARNASDNQTKALGYYTEALKADATNQRLYDLTRMGLPADIASSLAMTLGYLPATSPQAKQIIQYIMTTTGLNVNQLPQSLLNTGEALTPVDDSADILRGFMGVNSGN